MASSKSLKRKRHSDQWWANNAPPGVLRCTAHMKSGGQCNQEAVPGLNVCGDHGGKTPAAIAAAFNRLGETVEGAADTVRDIMNDASAPPRDRLAAAAHVMKLLGMEKERHEVRVQLDPVEELFRSIAADPDGTYDATAVQVQALPARDYAQEALDRAEEAPDWDTYRAGLTHDEDDVVDAELVEEAPARRAPKTGTASTQPPKHILADLERLGLW